jgi:hypothetical protein
MDNFTMLVGYLLGTGPQSVRYPCTVHRLFITENKLWENQVFQGPMLQFLTHCVKGNFKVDGTVGERPLAVLFQSFLLTTESRPFQVALKDNIPTCVSDQGSGAKRNHSQRIEKNKSELLIHVSYNYTRVLLVFSKYLPTLR